MRCIVAALYEDSAMIHIHRLFLMAVIVINDISLYIDAYT